MILGIGSDIVQVARFKAWHSKPIKQLKKIFSDHEIAYCLEIPKKSAERFAARFAAKEAFYKAYSYYCASHTVSFTEFCTLVEIEKNELGAPIFKINQQLALPENIKAHISISHERESAIGMVVLELRLS